MREIEKPFDPVFYELWLRWRRGEPDAMDRIWSQYINFIKLKARHFASKCRFLSAEDLMSPGYLGLVEAVERYDPSYPNLFLSYAGDWIVSCIREEIARQDRLVYLPLRYEGLGYKLQREAEAFQRQYGREPSLEELAEYTYCSLEVIQSIHSFDLCYNLGGSDPSAIEGVWEIDGTKGYYQEDEIDTLLTSLEARR